MIPERAKDKEAEYFKKQEAELIEKLRTKASETARRQDLAQELGVADEGILKAFEDLGFSRETVTVFHLLPLIQVAWADGEVTPSERDKIIEAARARGVNPGTAAYDKLNGLLTTKPRAETFDAAMRIMRAVFESFPDDKRVELKTNLVSYAEAVASASGGFLGLGRVSAEERAIIERVARELEASHHRAAKALLDQL